MPVIYNLSTPMWIPLYSLCALKWGEWRLLASPRRSISWKLAVPASPLKPLKSNFPTARHLTLPILICTSTRLHSSPGQQEWALCLSWCHSMCVDIRQAFSGDMLYHTGSVMKKDTSHDLYPSDHHRTSYNTSPCAYLFHHKQPSGCL